MSNPDLKALKIARIISGWLALVVLLLLWSSWMITGGNIPIASQDRAFVAILMGMAVPGFVIGLMPRVALRLWPIAQGQPPTVLYAVSSVLSALIIQLLPLMGVVASVTAESMLPFAGAFVVWALAAVWVWPKRSRLEIWMSRQSSESSAQHLTSASS
ncbi:hypothetical protein [Anaerosoma tenue]|uniref:hypothetical protein n=1 Tax=Anaerosoma tenue TaxID=2933588 RepID=UPI002260DC23|nr:hypothetical protein [Anaerosoma tenue]MCK8115923.1 hypothetical protein [Anaerosoma tenue]